MADVNEVRRVALLAGQLQWATMEQLEFLNEQVTRVLAVTGFARVEIVFENGHFAFIYPAPGLKAPKPKGGE